MKLPTWLKIVLRVLVVLSVVAVAWTTRWRALTTLGVDFDEDDYLRAAQEYKALIKSGDWAGFMEANYRPEHPPLAKIIFGISILGTEDASLTNPEQQNWSLPQDQLLAARSSSAVLGSLTAALVALVNPLAGLFLAVHAITVKYTSQIMLEALPAFTSMVTILAYLRWKKSVRTHSINNAPGGVPAAGEKGKSNFWMEIKSSSGWLVLSAAALGMTAASKYLYCVVGFAILIDWVITSIERRGETGKWKFPWEIFAWGALSLVFFVLTDPYLWPDIFGRLKESLLFHTIYSTTAPEIASAGFPTWQPILWFFFDIRTWNPNHAQALFFDLDWLIALAAVYGFILLWKRERLYVLWMIVGLAFLLAWPTKWPQYILTLTVPVTLAAGELCRWMGGRFVNLFKKPKAA